MKRLSLRLRVAVAFAVTTAAALLVFGTFLYVRVESTLTEQARDVIRGDLDSLMKLTGPARVHAVETMTGESFAQAMTPGGHVVASSPQVSTQLVTPTQLPADGGSTSYRDVADISENGEDLPAMLVLRSDSDGWVVVGTTTEDIKGSIDGVRAQLLIGGPLALALAALAGYLLAGRALRPLEEIRRRATLISTHNSEERLPLPSTRDELYRLGQTLNAMLDRLAEGLERERRFVAEASHELRTPLAMLRMELDLALSRPRSTAELADALRSASEEVERLSRLSEDLLAIARGDEQDATLDREEFDVAETSAAVVARFARGLAAENRDIRLAGDTSARVVADRNRIDRALTNLVDNAMRHGSGDVEVRVTSDADGVSIAVADEGSWQHEPAAEVFTPAADSRGLGLRLARTTAELHGGSLSHTGGSGTERTVARLKIPRGR
jgi:signal transduction histidine kinase